MKTSFFFYASTIKRSEANTLTISNVEKSEPEIPNRGKTTNDYCDIRDFTTTPLPIPKFFLVVYLLKLSSECLVSYDPHFPGNDGTKNINIRKHFQNPKPKNKKQNSRIPGNAGKGES